MLQIEDLLELEKGSRIAATENGGILIGTNLTLRRFDGEPAAAARSIIDLVDGKKTVEEICAALTGTLDRESILNTIEDLLDCAIRVKPKETRLAAEKNARAASRILVVGEGRLARWLETQIASLGQITLWDKADWRELTEVAAAAGLARDAEPAQGTPGLGEGLASRLSELDLVISAAEGVPYRAIHALNTICRRAGTSFLPVLMEDGVVTIGPTLIHGKGPCPIAAAALTSDRPGGIESRDLLSFFENARTLEMSGRHWSETALLKIERTVRREVRGLSVDGIAPQLVTSLVQISHGGEHSRKSILGAPACPECERSARQSQPDSDKENAGAEKQARASIDEVFWLENQHEAKLLRDGICRRIGVIGGGTAGYLTALALQKVHPNLEVTLIESSTVPIIGVGEATTPLMPAFLHGLLGFPAHEFFEEVKPTFKLGIKYIWGDQGDYHFDYPFGRFAVLEPYAYDREVVDHSLYAMLLASDRFPIARMEDGQLVSFLRSFSAYHLDNVRFVHYLAKKAKERKIQYIDALIKHVEVREAFDGAEEVAAIILDDGRRLEFDLYVDCTGFRSLLLGKALKTKFISYDRSLFADQAAVAAVPHGGRLKPYTTAETMDSGWCWNIPQMEDDHRGYVHSSAFCKLDDAVAEMRRKNPKMGDHWSVKFRSGRHEEFWRGNVVAMGNAYAFVEPLESTALHMLITQIRLFLDALPVQPGQRGIQRCLGRRVAEQWDYIKWFLALHYRFNRKLDTPFWRACRAEVDLSGHEELLAHYQERGPLSYYRAGSAVFRIPDAIWGPIGIDMILMGQGCPPPRRRQSCPSRPGGKGCKPAGALSRDVFARKRAWRP